MSIAWLTIFAAWLTIATIVLIQTRGCPCRCQDDTWARWCREAEEARR